MTNSFVTLEDVNGTIYNNQNFYWHEIDTSVVSTDNDFTDVKIDFCKVSREKLTIYQDDIIRYTFKINSENWTKGYCVLNANGDWISHNMFYDYSLVGDTLTIELLDENWSQNIVLVLFCGVYNYSELTETSFKCDVSVLGVYYDELGTSRTFDVYPIDRSIDPISSDSVTLNKGYNQISYTVNPNLKYECGFVFVNLVKSDFQFNCTQSLVLGKVNTVRLGADPDYKPSGSMIGTNTPTITVLYGSTYIPVRFDTSLNDYVFDIDLTDKQNEGKFRFNVLIEANDVINASETEVTLNSSFETINNETKLQTLFRNGGIGRLGANITLTNDLTISKDVLILGNSKTINMNSHKIVVPTERTFKASETIFTNGYNTIQQYTQSTVELNNCTFTDCTGLGSVIDCQLDIESLEIENDFTTNITGCTFTNNDLCILHGGELNIENCTVTGKIGNPSYPYFLYQTDGNAIILQSDFTLQSNTQISTDIEFNSCIFICGETATINGYDHTQLQNNNITAFTTTQRNTSSINVTYYYPTISDYITLESSKGYCHSVSDVDYVFKSNVTVRRNS